MKAHLLFADQDFAWDRELPANSDDLVQDLELTAVLSVMAQGDTFLYDTAAKVVLAGLTDPGAIRYRQQVLADCLAEPAALRQMYDTALGALLDKRKLWGYAAHYPSSILSAAVSHTEALVARLRQLREIADATAGRFRSPGLRALMSSLQADLDDEYFETVQEHLRQLRFRDGELMSARLGRDNSGIDFVLRYRRSRKGWKERVGLAPRSSYAFTIPPRDEAGGQALSDMVNRGVNQVANALAQSADHMTSYFTMLRAELGFYLGCLNLADELAARGQPTVFPEPVAPQPVRFRCIELRDISLALRIEKVVGNNVTADGKPLVIVTGANSGGKSTFLRSAGLAQLMMQAGMFVTASSFRAGVCQHVFTHFIREEDADMISGRLDEELSRMSRLADDIRPHSLVLFNESFAATNEREGSEIARQVVRALLEADVRVIFVTHQYDFSSRFYGEDQSRALFLRADRRADGERDFRLVEAEPLPTSYGVDLYYRIGGWLDEAAGEPGPREAGLTAGDRPARPVRR